MLLKKQIQIVGARNYSPDTGRFLSEDPIRFKSGDKNLYRYVNNNPLKFVDPDGEHPVLIWVFKQIVKQLGKMLGNKMEGKLDPKADRVPRVTPSCNPNLQSCAPKTPNPPIIPPLKPDPPQVCPGSSASRRNSR